MTITAPAPLFPAVPVTETANLETELETAPAVDRMLYVTGSRVNLGHRVSLKSGDEVGALVRLRVTGVSERAPLADGFKATVTTDAELVQVIDVDATPVNPDERLVPASCVADAERRVARWQRAGIVVGTLLAGGFWADFVATVVSKH